MSIDAKLKALNLEVPAAPKPVANYVPVVRAGNLLFLSGVLPSRDGQLIMVDDARMRLNPGETPQMRRIRFRTLGCYPLTGAIESNATSLLDIVEEMLVATSSERQGRVIDKDQAASMEKKKQEGYF